MSPAINFNIYKYAILSLKQGVYKGVRTVAKPLALLSLFECIDNGSAINNMLYFDDVELAYDKLNKKYNLNVATKIQYPFYFLQSDGFYHLRWKGKEIKTKSPSAKMLRDNVEFAYLDNALWDMLQDAEIREQYKSLIIENFLKNK